MKNAFIPVCCLTMTILFSCTKYSDIKIRDQQKMLVALGEVKHGEPVAIHLFKSRFLSDIVSAGMPLNDASVTLCSKEGLQLSVLENMGNGRWSSPYRPADKKELSFKIKTKDKEWQINTIIPDEFSAGVTIKSTQETTRNISLKTTGQSINSYYIIEFIKIDSNGASHLLEIESSSPLIDNNIYNELITPAPRIFFRSSAKNSELGLTLLHLNPSFHYQLKVKSVEPDYYKYLYEYELQKSRGNLNVPFFPISNKYLGIIGGCRVKEISIK